MERDIPGGDALTLAMRLAAPRAGERVLDLSGRAGSVALRLAETAASVEAVQPTGELVEEGRRQAQSMGRRNVFFHSHPLELLPFDTGQFDLVLLCQALPREGRPLAALSEARRVLAPAGRLVLQEVAAFGDPALDLRIWEMERRREPGFMLFYELDELRALVESAGLEVDEEISSDLTQNFEYWAGPGDAGGSLVAESKKAFFSLSPALQERLDLSLADGRISFTYRLVTLRATLA